MTFTENTIANLTDLAGEGYRWDAVRGCSKPTSKAKAPLRMWLAAAQGYICPQCGDSMTQDDVSAPYVPLADVALDAVNFCHIVPRGPLHKGWLPGNVFVGHARCNGYTLGSVDHIMTFDMFARPDVVVTDEWPSMTALVRGTLG